MSLVSVTRLRLRATRYFLPFAWHAFRSALQARHADGALSVATRRAEGSHWTLTVWRDKAAMRAFMLGGAHRDAMPRLQDWCDEAAVAHWEQDGAIAPAWREAERRLAAEGRLSAVKFPSPAQRAGRPLGTAEHAP
jgi:heme-degrading monooxygenase HmoA